MASISATWGEGSVVGTLTHALPPTREKRKRGSVYPVSVKAPAFYFTRENTPPRLNDRETT